MYVSLMMFLDFLSSDACVYPWTHGYTIIDHDDRKKIRLTALLVATGIGDRIDNGEMGHRIRRGAFVRIWKEMTLWHTDTVWVGLSTVLDYLGQ